jgi:Tfp pilus assembly protein PilV
MRRSRLQRGATLIEAVFAMGVLLVGATGLAGLQRQSSFFMGDARRAARAAAFGQDLVNQIELWDYTDARLSNPVDNDADVGDAAGGFETSADPIADGLADHAEADLGSTFTGLPADLLQANDMERYWNVAELDDFNTNGVWDSKRIAVVVRWRAAGSWRKVVFMTTKINTADVR